MYVCSESHATDCISKIAAYSPAAAMKLQSILETYGASAGYFAAMILLARQSARPDESKETVIQRSWDFANHYPEAAPLLRSAIRQLVRDLSKRPVSA